MRTPMRAAAALGALALAVAGAAGQEERAETPPAAATFGERVEVEIVNLDVVVTDRRGEPVTGLGREDFALRVDGAPTPITNFYVVEREGERSAAAPETPSAAPPSAPAPPAPPAATAAPDEQGLHLVVLFDNREATPGEQKRVSRQLAAELEKGLEGRGSVAYYDGGIKVHQPFTADVAVLAAAVRDMADLGVGGYSAAFELRNLLRDLEGGENDDFDLVAMIDAYAERQAADSRRVLDALAGQVDALAGLPGRKMLLFVSAGLDLEPGKALLDAARARAAQPGAPRVGSVTALDRATASINLTPALRELTRRANAGRVALYAIGTGAASFSPVLGPEHGGTIDIDSPTGGRFWSPVTEARLRAGMGSGLQLMAAVTGGKALTGSDNYDLLAAQIGRDAGYVYSLGFRAPEGGPGRHRVAVEVPGRGGLTLRHREEFVISTPVERAAERTLGALLWGEADNALGIAAQFLPPERSREDRDLLVLPVLVVTPFANLTLLPEGKVHRGRITILVVAQDGEGRLSEVQTIEAPIAIPAAQLEQALAGVAGYRVPLLVRPGPHRLAIAVRDEIGNVVATLVVEHDVPAPPGKT